MNEDDLFRFFILDKGDQVYFRNRRTGETKWSRILSRMILNNKPAFVVANGYILYKDEMISSYVSDLH